VVNKVVTLLLNFLQQVVFGFKRIQLESLQNSAIKAYKQQLKYSKKHEQDGTS